MNKAGAFLLFLSFLGVIFYFISKVKSDEQDSLNAAEKKILEMQQALDNNQNAQSETIKKLSEAENKINELEIALESEKSSKNLLKNEKNEAIQKLSKSMEKISQLEAYFIGHQDNELVEKKDLIKKIALAEKMIWDLKESISKNHQD